jgi:inner membrane protein
MDNLTHTLVGLAMGEAGLRRKLGRGTTLTLAVASNLPDLDAVLAFFSGGEALLFRRMFTHSVFGIPIIAALAAFLFHLLYKHISWRALFGLCLLGMGVHVFFDLINSYGVVLLYPLSLKRFELAWVFIIDLILWGILVLPFLISMLWKHWLEKLTRIALMLMFTYVAFCGLARFQATRILNQIAVKEGLTPNFVYVFPEALGPHRFRGVVREGEEYQMYMIYILSGRYGLKERFHTEENSSEAQVIRLRKEVRRLEWFFKAPVWKKVSEKGVFEVFDLRFKSLVLEWRKVPFGFRFKSDSINSKSL